MSSLKEKINFISKNAWTCDSIDITSYAYERLSENGFEKSISPYVVGLRITNKCSFNCPKCYVSRSSMDMRLSTVSHLLNILPAKPLYIFLTGGDPFLNEEVFDIIDAIYKKRIGVKLHSTGILEDSTLNNLRHNIHKIESIQISIDSIKRFNEFRPSNVIEPITRIEQFISEFNKTTNININYVLSNDNKNCIFDVIDFCSKVGINMLSISPIITSKANEIVFDNDNIDYYYNIVKYSVDRRVKLKQEPYCHPWSIKKLLNFSDEYGDNQLFCPAQKTEFEVDMNGNVYPCPFLYNEKHFMGNIFDNSFEEIWHSGCKELNHMIWSSNTKCINCSMYKDCGGGCYAMAYALESDYDERCCL